MKLYITSGFVLISTFCITMHSHGVQSLPKAGILHEDSLTQINGYYVVRFEKKAIAEKEKNRQNRLKGKPYKIPIDSQISEDFFFPANNDSINLRNLLNELPDKNSNAIYLYCTRRNYAMFYAQFHHESKSLNLDTCATIKLTSYYILDKKDKYCYQIYYLSGYWETGVVSTLVHKQLFQNKIKHLDNSSPITIYLLSKITFLKELQSAPLKLWKVVPDLFDK